MIKFNDKRYKFISRTIIGNSMVKIFFNGHWLATTPTMAQAISWAKEHRGTL